MSRAGRIVLGVLLAVAATVEIGWVVVRHQRSRVDPYAHLVRHALHELPAIVEARGRTQLSFRGPTEDCKAVRIEFAQPIGGAVVEVTAWKEGVVLRPPSRLEDQVLDVDLDDRCFERVTVLVHNHLRPRPWVRKVTWFGRARNLRDGEGDGPM